jgi:hypothetical protein
MLGNVFTFTLQSTSKGVMEYLPGLKMWTEQLRKANLKAAEANQKAAEANHLLEQEKRKVIEETVDTKTYCEVIGISRVTLISRRNKGKIEFVRVGTNYRYFLPKKGVEHACI